ncbi:unnamed protein product [Adineta steineri]|uniref:Uncharacterized protein n=1 Tax=Adineta steineri TaxID=433720 RepID=A0A818KHV4_9BILA|nr:unnamed protein product [Adineta steineri]CAF3558476.1 unnamed protein product [Adineta steineri]
MAYNINRSNEDGRRFPKSNSSQLIDCHGRPCAKCGKCRDWYYTGDQAGWRWIQNQHNWTSDDYNHWHQLDFYAILRKRDDATCACRGRCYYVLNHGPDADGCHLDYHCLCEDNVWNSVF